MTPPPEIYELPIVYQIPGMENCLVKRDILYNTVAGTELAMDVYTPHGLARGACLPGVLFVHGGPVVSELPPPKEWAAFRSYGQLLAASGLIGITFNYRHAPDTDWEVSAADISTAVRYLSDHSQELGLDPARFCTWIFSGGGRFLPALLESAGSWLSCLVLYYTLLEYPDHGNNAALLAQAFQKPILAARAGYDNPILNRSMDAFIAEASTAQAGLTLIDYAQGYHGFDIFQDNQASQAIVAETLDFIRAAFS